MASAMASAATAAMPRTSAVVVGNAAYDVTAAMARPQMERVTRIASDCRDSQNCLQRKSELRRPYNFVTKVSETETKSEISAEAAETTEELEDALKSALKSVQEAWDNLDDKVAVGGLGFAAIVVLWASTGLIGAIDKLPLIPAVFEFVGILFSGWFVYRYLLFQPDREELLKVIDDAKSKITGQ